MQWCSFLLLSIFLSYDVLRVVATGRFFLFSEKFWRSLANVFDVLLVLLPVSRVDTTRARQVVPPPPARIGVLNRAIDCFRSRFLSPIH